MLLPIKGRVERRKMIEKINVGDIVIGEGIPKICIPIVAKNLKEALDQIELIKNEEADLAEFRVDHFTKWETEPTLTLKKIKEALGEIALIYTFRTSKEGGEKEISTEEYIKLNEEAINSGYVDILDLEMSRGKEYLVDILALAKKKNIKVIGSYHNFQETPNKDFIIDKLKEMQDFGVDIPKVALMPQSKKDLLVLLDASLEMKETLSDRPFIAISMSKLGLASRLLGEVFGSSITFGKATESSAPGQIDGQSLKFILDVINNR